jgi:hypothetical protein
LFARRFRRVVGGGQETIDVFTPRTHAAQAGDPVQVRAHAITKIAEHVARFAREPSDLAVET